MSFYTGYSHNQPENYDECVLQGINNGADSIYAIRELRDSCEKLHPKPTQDSNLNIDYGPDGLPICRIKLDADRVTRIDKEIQNRLEESGKWTVYEVNAFTELVVSVRSNFQESYKKDITLLYEKLLDSKYAILESCELSD